MVEKCALRLSTVNLPPGGFPKVLKGMASITDSFNMALGFDGGLKAFIKQVNKLLDTG